MAANDPQITQRNPLNDGSITRILTIPTGSQNGLLIFDGTGIIPRIVTTDSTLFFDGLNYQVSPSFISGINAQISGISLTPGPTGSQGPSGLQGSPGISGAKGDQGNIGPSGLKGDVGATGPSGLQGLSGARGDIGLTGPSGLQGISGAMGLSGAQGIAGPSGNQGNIGLSGLQGIQGLIGPSGLQGLVGPSGLIGPSGVMGQQGTSGINATITSLANSGASGLMSSGDFSKLSNYPVYVAPSQSSVTRSTVSSATSTGFQISSTRNSLATYSLTIVTTASIAGNAFGTIVLEICPTNSTTASDWVEVSRFTNGQALSLAVALQSVQTTASCLHTFVPAGYFVRIRTISTSGTPTFTYNCGQEVLLS